MKKVIFSLLFLFLGLSSVALADSVTLLNDSPFELTATVLAADGTFLGQETFQPGEQINWNTQHSATQLDIPQDSPVSISPYSVIWKCKYKGFYSICMNVPAGGFVSANNCEGPHYCEPKPKKEKNDNDKTSCRECIKLRKN